MSSPSTVFAKIISYLFHPLLLPTIGLFIIFHLDETAWWVPHMETQLFLYGFTFLATFLVPLLGVLVLLKMKQISSPEMPTRQERKIPYLVAAVFYFMEYYFLMRWDVPVLIKALIFAAALLVFSVLIVNLFWKISAHMTAIGGLCGIMVSVSARLQINLHFLLIALFLAAGIIAFSRLKLNSHNPAQVYVGFLMGVLIPLTLFLIIPSLHSFY
jgi:hypothetical protein